MISLIEAVIQSAKKEDTQMNKAITIALKAHGDQKYGELPYFVHLLEVDQMVVKMYKSKGLTSSQPYSKQAGDEMDNLRAVAFLHDIIEDTGVGVLDLLEAGLNEDVVTAVACITKMEELGQTYEEYIDLILQNPLARKVKLCDTSANLMNSIKDGSAKRINKYTKQIQLLGGF